MIYAYDKNLLYKAQMTLAWMFDYAVRYINVTITEFYRMFVESGVADDFGVGDSSIVAGKSGPELAYMVLKKFDEDIEYVRPEITLERSREYWLGWSLAYYQWKRNVSFREIGKIDVDDLMELYDVYHEMDVEQFVLEIDRRRSEERRESQLKRLRMYAMLSQSELANKAQVPVRTIQQYEQRQKNINNAKAETVIRLARALYCRVEDLMEM